MDCVRFRVSNFITTVTPEKVFKVINGCVMFRVSSFISIVTPEKVFTVNNGFYQVQSIKF